MKGILARASPSDLPSSVIYPSLGASMNPAEPHILCFEVHLGTWMELVFCNVQKNK